VVEIASPVTTGWLGLPAATSVPLIFGILRKELAIVLLQNALRPEMTIQDLTGIQMIVFSLVTMIYIPCIATIAACIREFGWRKALAITVIDIVLALLLGGLAYRILPLAT